MKKEVIKYKKNIPKDNMRVVASALIYNEDRKVLAIKREDTDERVTYVAPGGRPNAGEPLRNCAMREAKEETNLDVKIVSVAGILEKEYETGIWTFILYNTEVVSGSVENSDPEESIDVIWVDIEMLDHYEEILWIKNS